MELTKVNQNGQVSIPAKIRKKFKLKTGDFLGVSEDFSGKIILFPVSVEEKSPWKELKKYEDRGVDLSLLGENLKKTPTERLERHQNMLDLVEEARKAGIKKRAQTKRFPSGT